MGQLLGELRIQIPEPRHQGYDRSDQSSEGQLLDHFLQPVLQLFDVARCDSPRHGLNTTALHPF
jgi:hypothetical protein